MTDGSTAMPSGSGEEVEENLSPAHLDLYWYFADSRNRRGTPTATRSHAQTDFGLKWAQLKALMQEIEDAGYWSIGENGTPHFNLDKIPPRPPSITDALLDAGSTTPAAPAPGHGRAGTTSLSLDNKTPGTHTFGVFPYGTGGAGSPRMIIDRSSKTALLRSVGREAWELVDYFQYKVRKGYGGFCPDAINTHALGANMKRWMAVDQIPKEVVKMMIDLFVAQYDYQRKGIPAWKMFLAKREMYQSMALDRFKDKKRSTPQGKSSWAGYMHERNGVND